MNKTDTPIPDIDEDDANRDVSEISASEEDNHDYEDSAHLFNDENVFEELKQRFVLCLSMQLRNDYDREKFFVTYIEKPNLWRKVTITCDYRDARPNTLEADLKGLHFLQDKMARIYGAIKGSLKSIKFYDTVTNLSVETSDNNICVDAAEDVNEIIEFPLLSAIKHLQFELHENIVVRESSVYFDSHLSGFVYIVKVDGKVYVKKEISTPDSVEEFLYEINALAALRRSARVINLVGVVTDETGVYIKGVLIEFAVGRSVADFFGNLGDAEIPWIQKEKWARQIVSGMSDIHEAGFIQGDCTISNIVFDSEDNVKIVDINRRGCPIGWEPPEFEGLLCNKQTVSLYIGVKSDLFQLGMILWAIAKQVDEPEREDQPLMLTDPKIPEYFQEIVRICLAEDPVDRASAKQLLQLFPLVIH